MIATLGALAPVALVIALGWGLRRARFPGDAFWAPAERLTYYVLFPALLVNNLAGAPLAALPVAPMALAMAAAILAGAFVALTRAVEMAPYNERYRADQRRLTELLERTPRSEIEPEPPPEIAAAAGE